VIYGILTIVIVRLLIITTYGSLNGNSLSENKGYSQNDEFSENMLIKHSSFLCNPFLNKPIFRVYI
jgi:hypothetical protein